MAEPIMMYMQGSKFTTAMAIVAPQTGRGAPWKKSQSTAILAVPFLSLAAVPPEDAKKKNPLPEPAGEWKMTVIFSSDRPFANCSASGESCDAAVVVENFTTIASIQSCMHMYSVRVHEQGQLKSAWLAVLHTAWQCGPLHYDRGVIQ